MNRDCSSSCKPGRNVLLLQSILVEWDNDWQPSVLLCRSIMRRPTSEVVVSFLQFIPSEEDTCETTLKILTPRVVDSCLASLPCWWWAATVAQLPSANLPFTQPLDVTTTQVQSSRFLLPTSCMSRNRLGRRKHSGSWSRDWCPTTHVSTWRSWSSIRMSATCFHLKPPSNRLLTVSGCIDSPVTKMYSSSTSVNRICWGRPPPHPSLF